MNIPTAINLPFTPLHELVEPAMEMTREFLATYPESTTYTKGQVDEALDKFSNQHAPSHEKCVVPDVNAQQWSKRAAAAQKKAAHFKCQITGERTEALIGCHICSKGLLKNGSAAACRQSKTCFAPGCPATPSVNNAHSSARRHGNMVTAVYISALMVAALKSNKIVVDAHNLAVADIVAGRIRRRGRPRSATKTPPDQVAGESKSASARLLDGNADATAADAPLCAEESIERSAARSKQRQVEYVTMILVREFGISYGAALNATRLCDMLSCVNLAADSRSANYHDIVNLMRTLPGFNDGMLQPNPKAK